MKALSSRSFAQRHALPVRCPRTICQRSLIVPLPRKANLTTRVAAAEEQQTSFQGDEQGVDVAPSIMEVDPLEEEYELQELDQAQEDLLKWMMLDEQTQEEDLDEMVDYDEFGDEEYADMYEEVEDMLDAIDYDFKLGDKVSGTVIEVDDDGAYVEIGAKAIAFCPVTECSFARLKTVGNYVAACRRQCKFCGCAFGLPTLVSRKFGFCHTFTCVYLRFAALQPLEALRPGMKRDFMVVEDEEEYGQVIVSLAAMEVCKWIIVISCRKAVRQP